MEVEYELTIADMKAFFRFHKKHGPKLKPHPWARVILLGFAAVVIALLLLPSWLSVNRESEWVTGFCIGAIAGILIMVAFLFSLAMLGNLNMLRIYEREECRWLFARRRLKIAAECFEITNELQQLRYDWSVVWLIESTDEHGFFCTSVNQAHIIPRRAFQNRQAFEAFIDLACRYHKGLAPRESTEILDALPAEQTGITRPRHP